MNPAAHTGTYQNVNVSPNSSTGTVCIIRGVKEQEAEQGRTDSPTWGAWWFSRLLIQTARPVYVDEEHDQIVYNSNTMEIGVDYPIEYKSEHWLLRKTEKEVEFYKFYPEE